MFLRRSICNLAFMFQQERSKTRTILPWDSKLSNYIHSGLLLLHPYIDLSCPPRIERRNLPLQEQTRPQKAPLCPHAGMCRNYGVFLRVLIEGTPFCYGWKRNPLCAHLPTSTQPFRRSACKRRWIAAKTARGPRRKMAKGRSALGYAREPS